MGTAEPQSRVHPTLPVISTRELVLFPATMLPLHLTSAADLAALAQVEHDGRVVVAVRATDKTEGIDFDDLHRVATLAHVARRRTLQDSGGALVAVVGVSRVRLAQPFVGGTFLSCGAELVTDVVPVPVDTELKALTSSVRALAREIIEDTPDLPDELAEVGARLTEPGPLADWVAWALPLETRTRLEALAERDVRRRLQLLLEDLTHAREAQRLELIIRTRAEGRITDAQRQAILRQQLGVIREELGEEQASVEGGLHTRAHDAPLPPPVRQHVESELARLETLPRDSLESGIARTYLGWILDLPWSVPERARVELSRAATVLDEEHFGLTHVKRRILEHLAVLQLVPEQRAPALCLVGPPGVGKTSLGRSIAHALDRPFARVSLGGVHDESEIRGHRRTYVGALPGQIVRGIKRAGALDAVFVLDEIDKVTANVHGDPAAALLEVLDPEQNIAFRDNYLDPTIDLSRVLFVCTANHLDPIPPALLDRMEVIELTGYSATEKREIAARHLVPKALARHGLAPAQLAFPAESLDAIQHGWTREAGVRGLDAQISAICRARARALVDGDAGPWVVTRERLSELLGVARHRPSHVLAQRALSPGTVVGLAHTVAGGELLFVEALRLDGGHGELRITGQVRDVMRESARAAFSWLRAHASQYGLPARAFSGSDVHLHVPAGAVAKDGPSAGVAIVAAVLSALSGVRARSDAALTGEVTLSGCVLPVGGIREKLLAAHREGVREVVLPLDNRPDVEQDVPDEVRADLSLRYVSRVEDAVACVLPDVAARPRAARDLVPTGPRRTPRQPSPPADR